MILNENQKSLYNNCIFLNESLLKKKEPIPEAYYTTIKQLSSAIKSKLNSIKTIKLVTINKDYSMNIDLDYPTGKLRYDNIEDDKIWRTSIKSIDKILSSINKVIRDRTELHDTVSNYYLDFNEFIVKISFDHEDDNFAIRFSYNK